jgi:HSP20 family protein
MSIVRWEPFGEIDSMFNRLMPSILSRLPMRAVASNSDNFEWAPSADISETDKEYLIRAELPAVKKEDVKVTVDDGMITIEGRAFTATSRAASLFQRASMKALSAATAETAS